MFIQTEPTPNPATLKFLPGRTVLGDGTLELRSAEEAGRSRYEDTHNLFASFRTDRGDEAADGHVLESPPSHLVRVVQISAI